MKNISLVKKLLIGFGTLAVISLIIGFAVSNASAKAEVKVREAAQVQQKLVKDTADAALKVKQANIASYAKVVADAKIEADAKAKADLNTVPTTGSLFDLSVVPGSEEARIAKINGDIAVQAVIASQKKTASSNSTLTAPALTTPTLTTPIPVTTGVVESSINGNFDGWTGDTIFKLQNGQIWQQSSFAYIYHWAFSPKVTIYKSGATYKMKVDGVDSTISVTRIK
jgi:hypothetical protein